MTALNKPIERLGEIASLVERLLAIDEATMYERPATTRATIERAATALAEKDVEMAKLERERDQLRDKLHCMCGSPIDHSAWEGHTPVSVYDYSLDQERPRAERAEARVA